MVLVTDEVGTPDSEVSSGSEKVNINYLKAQV